MRFVAGPDFVKSAAGLDSRSQARIWKTLDKLRRSPDSRGLNVERLGGVEGVKSCRVSRAVRIILSQSGGVTYLLFVGQHDDAYTWAERNGQAAAIMATASALPSVLACIAAASIFDKFDDGLADIRARVESFDDEPPASSEL